MSDPSIGRRTTRAPAALRASADQPLSQAAPRDRVVDVLAVLVLGVFVALSANFALFAASLL